MKEILVTEKRDGIPCVIIFPCSQVYMKIQISHKQTRLNVEFNYSRLCRAWFDLYVTFSFLNFIYIFVSLK